MEPSRRQQSGPRVDLSRMRALDFVLVAMIFFGSAGALLSSKWQGQQTWPTAEAVVVYIDGAVAEKLSLDGDRQIPLLDGKLILEVRGSKVRVKKSDCPRQFCVHQGWATHGGESIICVPFKTVVELQSDSGPLVDAVVY